MNRLKLKWKIFAVMVGFCGLLLVILWLFQTVFLNDIYKLIRRGEISKAITMVGEEIDSVSLDDVISSLEETSEILVQDKSQQWPPHQKSPENLMWEERQENGMFKRKPEQLSEEKTFVRSDGTTITYLFTAMITPVNATVQTLQYELYCVTGIMLLLSVGVALLLARNVSKPLEKMNSGAKRLAMGQYDSKFDGKGFLEVCELSATLNTAATELSRVDGLRRELMANISHDLRTPLSLIYSYAEMMQDFPNEITAEQTKTIMEETKRLSTLVNDVLDISRLEAGGDKINMSEFSLTKSLQATVERVGELVKPKGYSLIFSGDEVSVVADEVKITQVFYNLLINAINYAGEDKQVVVIVTRRQKDVVVAVTDHGCGIPEDQLQYIWERYYKVDKNHKRAIMGTGLGLSIVKKIVELHNGSYGVNSTMGEGSSFWFSIGI